MRVLYKEERHSFPPTIRKRARGSKSPGWKKRGTKTISNSKLKEKGGNKYSSRCQRKEISRHHHHKMTFLKRGVSKKKLVMRKKRRGKSFFDLWGGGRSGMPNVVETEMEQRGNNT